MFKYCWNDLVSCLEKNRGFLGNNFIIALFLVAVLVGIWEILDTETKENFYKDVDV